MLLVVFSAFCGAACQSANSAATSQQQQSASATTTSTNNEPLGKSDRAPDSFAAEGYELRLAENEGKCVLQYTKGAQQGELVLGVAAPCRFARRSSGTYDGACGVRSHYYKDIRSAVLLVIGGKQAPGSIEPCTQELCGTEQQAVMVRQEGITASQVQHESNGALCPSNGPDEKVFSILAHQTP